MTGQTVAEARWRALDRDGQDKCRLARVDGGWMLIGHARFHDATGWARLDYVVRCDEAWHTLSADVSGTHAGRDVRLVLERGDAGWALNGQAQPQVADARDVDLAFTPATNLMPLRRLDGTQKVRAAWLTYPACEIRPLDQVYRQSAAEIVSYTAAQTGFSTQLCVDRSGFVTLYPAFWEGEVRHAD